MVSAPIWLIANWKMHGDKARVAEFAFALNAELSRVASAVRGVFCPPACYLASAMWALPANASLSIGAQNCHPEAQGAYTGDVSAPMLADIGCRYVIVGHSERRAAGETDAQVAAKTTAAIAAGLIPVVCVGESRATYEAKQTAAFLDDQMEGLRSLPKGSYLVAYEPIWAIGTGLTPTRDEIAAAHRHIKSALGSDVPVLYGGSVKPGNIGEIISISEVSGALIGGASLEMDSMRAMIAACK